MSLLQRIRGLGRRPLGPRQSRRSLRPGLEGLEKREVMTVAFLPALGNEQVYYNGTLLTGPINSNPNALVNPKVDVIFLGSAWNDSSGKPLPVVGQMVGIARNILNSSYFSGLAQYGVQGSPTFGGSWVDSQHDSLVSSTTLPNPMFAETQNVLADPLHASWKPAPGGNGTNSPIYVVVRANGDGGGSNDMGTVAATSTPVNVVDGAMASVSADQGNLDNFSRIFSHEVAERVTQGRGNGSNVGIGVQYPYVAGSGQIADGEADGNYMHRLGNTATGPDVAAYWSVVDQKFIVPDGNQQTVILKGSWTGMSFNNTFDLLAVETSPSDVAPTGSPMNASKTLLSLGNETFDFSTNPIRNVSLFTLSNTEFANQVWHNSGPGSNWVAITGSSTYASQLTTNGTSVFMLASKGGANQVWQYSGSGTNWAPITGTNTKVSAITASGNSVYMLSNNGSVDQVWQYGGSGTNWAPITGTNTNVSEIVSSASGLTMLANKGGANQVWQYSGTSNVWNTITGTSTHVSQIVSTGSSLYMLANNGGVDQVWQYSGVRTGWTAITGTNSSVSQLTACGDTLFMVASNGGVNVVWRYNGSGTNWTAITGSNTPVYQLVTQGNGLFMITITGSVAHTWEYSGTGNVWALVS